MKRPNVLYYLVGNQVSALAIWAGCGFFIYRWWIGAADTGVLILAVIASVVVLNASQKVADYSSWRRGWNAMGGFSMAAYWARLRTPLFLLIWPAIGVGVFHLDPHRPEASLAVLGYVLASMLIVGFLSVRRWRRWRIRHPRRPKEVLATISPRVPRKSPGPRQFYRRVPAYCVRVS